MIQLTFGLHWYCTAKFEISYLKIIFGTLRTRFDFEFVEHQLNRTHIRTRFLDLLNEK